MPAYKRLRLPLERLLPAQACWVTVPSSSEGSGGFRAAFQGEEMAHSKWSAQRSAVTGGYLRGALG